MMTYEEVWKI